MYHVIPLPPQFDWEQLDTSLPEDFLEAMDEGSLKEQVLRELAEAIAAGYRLKAYVFYPRNPLDSANDDPLKAWVREQAYAEVVQRGQPLHLIGQLNKMVLFCQTGFPPHDFAPSSSENESPDTWAEEMDEEMRQLLEEAERLYGNDDSLPPEYRAMLQGLRDQYGPRKSRSTGVPRHFMPGLPQEVREQLWRQFHEGSGGSSRRESSNSQTSPIITAEEIHKAVKTMMDDKRLTLRLAEIIATAVDYGIRTAVSSLISLAIGVFLFLTVKPILWVWKKLKRALSAIGYVLLWVIVYLFMAATFLGFIFMLEAYLIGIRDWNTISLFAVIGWGPIFVANWLFGLACGLKIETLGNNIRNRLGIEENLQVNNPLFSKPMWLNIMPLKGAVVSGIRARRKLHNTWLDIKRTPGYVWEVILNRDNARYRILMHRGTYKFNFVVRWTARFFNWLARLWDNHIVDAWLAFRNPEHQKMILMTPHAHRWIPLHTARLMSVVRDTLLAEAMMNADYRFQILADRNTYPRRYVNCARFGYWSHMRLADLRRFVHWSGLHRFWYVFFKEGNKDWVRKHPKSFWPDRVAILTYDCYVWLKPHLADLWESIQFHWNNWCEELRREAEEVDHHDNGD